jgi:hypothetical protein
MKNCILTVSGIDKTADEGSPTIDIASMITTTAKNLRNLIRELQNSPDDLEIVKV